MAGSEKIDKLWQRVYSMTQSHSAAKTLGSFLSLPPRFEQDLLNDIARLKMARAEDQADLVQKIAGQIHTAGITGLIGSKDLDELHDLLSTIEGGEL